MSATDAAINLVVGLLRADPVLSLPHGDGTGSSPAGVNGEVHQGTELPAETPYPAILIVLQSSEGVGLLGNGNRVADRGLFLVKIHWEGEYVGTGLQIAARVEIALRGLRRQEWEDDDGTRYYVAAVDYIRDEPQPWERIGDRVVQFKNLAYRSFGYRAS